MASALLSTNSQVFQKRKLIFNVSLWMREGWEVTAQGSGVLCCGWLLHAFRMWGVDGWTQTGDLTEGFVPGCWRRSVGSLKEELLEGGRERGREGGGGNKELPLINLRPPATSPLGLLSSLSLVPYLFNSPPSSSPFFFCSKCGPPLKAALSQPLGCGVLAPKRHFGRCLMLLQGGSLGTALSYKERWTHAGLNRT